MLERERVNSLLSMVDPLSSLLIEELTASSTPVTFRLYTWMSILPSPDRPNIEACDDTLFEFAINYRLHTMIHRFINQFRPRGDLLKC